MLVPNKGINRISIFKEYGNNNEKEYDLGCDSNDIPVPNFWSTKFADTANKCNLQSNFDIFVINARQGIYINKKYLKENINLPHVWEHGYSKGVALSRKNSVIIYWVIVW